MPFLFQLTLSFLCLSLLMLVNLNSTIILQGLEGVHLSSFKTGLLICSVVRHNLRVSTNRLTVLEMLRASPRSEAFSRLHLLLVRTVLFFDLGKRLANDIRFRQASIL